MPVDMLVFPMLDFDVILSMNWLNKYKVVIDCYDASLSFASKGIQVRHQLTKPRPSLMPTMELWKRLKLVALIVKEAELTVKRVPVVREFPDVFPEDLLRLPPARDIEFGIDVMLVISPISKQLYKMALIEM